MMPKTSPLVSLCAHARDAACTLPARTITDCLTAIQTGEWADVIALLRGRAAAFGREAIEAQKRDLPGVLFAGLFSHRDKASCTERSGFLILDLDDLEAPEETRELIANSPHVVAAFVSASGTGVKALVAIDLEHPHEACFAAAAQHFREAFGLEVDPSGKDISRLCFVSHDPSLYLAQHCSALTPQPPPLIQPAPMRHTPLGPARADLSPGDDYDLRGDWRGLLQSMGWTTRNGKYWTRPGKSSGISASWGNAKGLDGGERFHVFSSNAAPLEPNKNYRPWQLFAIYCHGGDFSAAAAELRRSGFGSDRPRPERHQEAPPETDGTQEEAAQPPATEGTQAPRLLVLEPPPIQTAEDADCEPIEEPVVLVDGLIHRQSISSIAGPSKARKTWALMHLALAVSSGANWLGHKTVRSPVLYLDLELHPFLFRKRRWEIGDEMGISRKDHFLTWSLRGVCPTLPQLRDTMVSVCKSEGVGMIVIDPFYMLNHGEENSAEDMREAIRGFQSLAYETGAAIIYSHHFAKGNHAEKSAQDRAAGSGVHARGCDTIMTLTPHKEDEHIVLEAATRGFRGPPARVLRWKHPVWELAPEMDPEDLKVPGRRPAKKKEEEPPPAAPRAKGRPPKISLEQFNALVEALGEPVNSKDQRFLSALGISAPTLAQLIEQRARQAND